MSKLMWIAGILLIAVGIALGLMVFVSTAAIIGWGIDLQLAAMLFVGGILSLGLGSVISVLEVLRIGPFNTSNPVAVEVPAAPIPEFGRRGFEPGDHLAPVAIVPAAAVEAIEISEPVKETIAALEQARQNIEEAFEPKPEPVEDVPAETPAEPEAETVAADEPTEAEVTEAEVIEDGQLYVVEERLIRARPARILSDGTVEAETAEGWMRFENLEHLDEYLDAMAPSK